MFEGSNFCDFVDDRLTTNIKQLNKLDCTVHNGSEYVHLWKLNPRNGRG